MKTRRHRFWIHLNTGTALLLAAILVCMINYLSYRHYYRADWSAQKFYSLSDKTIRLLNSLETPIQITVFFERDNLLHESIQNLLREYQFHCDNLKIRWIDPNIDLAMAEEIENRYHVSEQNVVIFEHGDRSKYVRADDIAKTDVSTGVPRILSFRGEQVFSSAILEITQTSTPVVYFLTGHGERDINNFDQRKGYSKIRQLIEQDNAEVRTLELSSAKQIPQDCDALVIAGAAYRMSETEANLIEAWTRRNGRLMVLADATRTTGLEPLLRNWGVVLRNDVVLDPSRTITGREVFVSAYDPNHPITKHLSTTAATFHLPRSVEPDTLDQSADRPQVTPLALSSEKSWSETQLNDQAPSRFDEGTGDFMGPVSMAVAVEKGAPPGLLNMGIRPTRIVVFGDSGFVSNGGLSGSDATLFMSALNWLLDRQELIGIPPKEVTNIQLPKGDTHEILWITLIGIPSMIGLFGIILWVRRRK